MKVLHGAMLGLLAWGFALAAGAFPGGDTRPPVLAAAHPSLTALPNPQKMLGASKYTRTAACLPAGGVSQAEVLVAAANYLKENPQQQGLPPEPLLRNALRQAYPCPR